MRSARQGQLPGQKHIGALEAGLLGGAPEPSVLQCMIAPIDNISLAVSRSTGAGSATSPASLNIIPPVSTIPVTSETRVSHGRTAAWDGFRDFVTEVDLKPSIIYLGFRTGAHRACTIVAIPSPTESSAAVVTPRRLTVNEDSIQPFDAH